MNTGTTRTPSSRKASGISAEREPPMAIKLPAVDIVLVGMGWTGGIIAKELADTGLKIVGLERGADRSTAEDFSTPGNHDELRYAVRFDLMQNTARETLTFRHSVDQTALPMRQLGSFLPGEGLGRAGGHWNGVTWRWLPCDHQPAKPTATPPGPRPAAPRT